MPETPGSARWSRRDLLYSGAMSALFLGLLVVYGPVDIEQYHHSHPAVRVFHRILLEGHLPFWTDGFGLGTPLPIGETLALHPLFLLQQLMPLRWVLSLFWIVHLTLGSYFVLRLCDLVRIDSIVARLVALGFIASPVTANYSYTDDWPSVFLGWTMFPVLVFFSCRLAGESDRSQTWRLASMMVLLLSFVVWNTHLGYWITLGSILVCLVALLSRGNWRILGRFAAVVAATACVTGERLFFIVSEALRFPAGLSKISQDPFPIGAWIDQLHRPLSQPILASLVAGDFGSAVDIYLSSMHYSRIPFLGLAFSAAALWAVVRLAGRPSGNPHEGIQRAFAVCFILAAVLSILPQETLLFIPSGMWLYRDSATLFGLLAAGSTLSLWRRHGHVAKRVVGVALIIQAVQVALVALPPALFVYSHRDENVRFYEGPRATEFADWVEEATGGSRARTFLSPGVTRLLISERPYLADLGLLATGDLEPVGLLPVNGYFKNVSMDSLHPSLARFHGFIASAPEVIGDPAILDLLAIQFLLALDSETGLDLSRFDSAAPPFRLADGTSLLLMRNPAAWPRANLFRPSIEQVALEPRPECQTSGLLCADVSPLASSRLAEPVHLAGADGRHRLAVKPAEQDRVLVVSQLYRPGWRARSQEGRSLRLFPFAGTLLAIEVPPGVSAVQLTYLPKWRRALLLLGLVAALACVLILYLSRRTAHRRSYVSDESAAESGR